jgi:glucose-1-phosphate thymidylyltransferase
MLPLYDKPMIYYPLSILMLAGIREILIISTARDLPLFRDLLGNGNRFGMDFEYRVQETPRGIADAFIIGADFTGKESCALILGDNVFFGRGLGRLLRETRSRVEKEGGGAIFGYYVKDPQAYGVVECDDKGKALSIEEKPARPKSHYAVPGLYFYDNAVVDIAKTIQPSPRGEIEITAINNVYLESGRLSVKILGRGVAWLDTGTCDDLLAAGNFIGTIQRRQGMYISCIEEIAYTNNWITREELARLAEEYKTEYCEYLRNIAETA